MKKNSQIALLLPVLLFFFASCNKSSAWYENKEFINSLTLEDVGLEKAVIVNGLEHKVRLIDIDHDDLSDGSGKAHTTWEFANLISDSNGYSLATPWYWEEEGLYSRCLNYIEYSNLRKAIDGKGSAAAIEWFEKGSTDKSTTYTTSVLDMLPNSLKNVLKEVKKPVAIFDYFGTQKWIVDTDNYVTKLFPLSYRELTDNPTLEWVYEEGTTYEFYKGDNADRRIKYQVKWHDGALVSYTSLRVTRRYDGQDFTWDASSAAGYNSNNLEKEGGDLWLRSPSLYLLGGNYFAALCQSSSGSFSPMNSVAQYLMGVAPAFCI